MSSEVLFGKAQKALSDAPSAPFNRNRDGGDIRRSRQAIGRDQDETYRNLLRASHEQLGAGTNQRHAASLEIAAKSDPRFARRHHAGAPFEVFGFCSRDVDRNPHSYFKTKAIVAV